MALKIYVLLDHLNATAPIYQRVNKNQRVRLEKRPVDHAYLRITFADKNGVNQQLRLKLQTNEIDFQKQVKDLGIPANESFTQAERDAVRFTNGVLSTTNLTVQKYLDSGPQIEGFEGTWPDGRPMFKVYDPAIEIKNTNEDFLKRLKVANMIAEIDNVAEAQDLMLRLNGSHFTPPATLIECQNALVAFMDEADDPGLDAMMKKKLSLDEEVTIIISRARLAGIISFTAVKDQVSRKKGNGWVSLKTIASDIPEEEREMYFLQYLTSEDGKLLLNDLRKQVKEKKEPVS